MIEGYHESYRLRPARGNGIRVSDFSLFKWRVRLTDTELIYERAAINLEQRTAAPYAEQWRCSISSVRSIQIESAFTYDTKLTECYTAAHVGKEYAIFYGLTASDSKQNKDYGEPIYNAPNNHSSDKQWLLVLFAFLLDGTRRLIAFRPDATNAYGNRGFDDLLQQQTALTSTVHGARSRKQQEKTERIERARYL
jgi:hypothetical protein